MSEWDELRTRARQIETQLDAKLISFAKIGNRQGISSIEREIDELLIELDGITERMGAYADQPAVRNNATVTHTLTRHRDILQDYRNEYNKTKNNISASQAREDLLGSVQRDIEEYRGLNGSTRQDMYANERDHLLSSDRLADTAIEIARNGSKSNILTRSLALRFCIASLSYFSCQLNRFSSVKSRTQDHLRHQRAMLNGISTRMLDLAARFPQLNFLIQKISMRKRRDTVIMSSVIALCIIFILLYTFH